MRIVRLSLLISLLLLSACTQGARLSLEGGATVDFFATQHDGTPYGIKGRDGVLSLAATDVAGVVGLELGMSAVRWSGPYTANTLVGADFAYRLATGDGYFVRASVGPYYGADTVRTSSHWTFGVNLALGKTFNDGRNEFYGGYRHFSNGSAFGIGAEPNLSEEFLNCGLSFLF